MTYPAVAISVSLSVIRAGVTRCLCALFGTSACRAATRLPPALSFLRSLVADCEFVTLRAFRASLLRLVANNNLSGCQLEIHTFLSSVQCTPETRKQPDVYRDSVWFPPEPSYLVKWTEKYAYVTKRPLISNLYINILRHTKTYISILYVFVWKKPLFKKKLFHTAAYIFIQFQTVC